MFTFLAFLVLAGAGLGVLAWSVVGGAVLVRNIVAMLTLAWEAITAIPALARVARRRITGARRP